MGQILSLFPLGVSGGEELNFSVERYNSDSEIPATAAENTIAAITGTPFPGYQFSVEEPENPIDGLLWISTENLSEQAFNAIKGNTLMVYPKNAKQYVGGAWIDIDAFIYQDGEWAGPIGRMYLYKPGMADVLTPVGWKAVNSQVASAPMVSYTDTEAVITSQGQGGYTGVAHFNAVDVTHYNKINVSLQLEGTFNPDAIGPSVSGNVFGVWQTINSGYYEEKFVARRSLQSGDNDFVLDISELTGAVYVGVGIRHSSNAMTCRLYKVSLLK